jgi:hypothetical protein
MKDKNQRAESGKDKKSDGFREKKPKDHAAHVNDYLFGTNKRDRKF